MCRIGSEQADSGDFEDCVTAEWALMQAGEKIQRNYWKTQSEAEQNSYKVLVNAC